MFKSKKNKELTLTEKQEIVEALQYCVGEAQSTFKPTSKKLDKLDVFMMSSVEERGTYLYLFKTSDCVFMLDSPIELSQPIYWSNLSPQGQFTSGADSKYENTKYEMVFFFVNACLESGR